MSESRTYFVKTVGGPLPEDSRDGAMHEIRTAELPKHMDIEPLDFEAPEEDFDELAGEDARYWLASSQPEQDADGRDVWLYRYVPHGESPDWTL